MFAEPLDAGGVADQDRRDDRPAAHLDQQLGAVSLDQLEQRGLELIDLAGDASDRQDLLARDPDTRAGGQLAQGAVDPVEHA